MGNELQGGEPGGQPAGRKIDENRIRQRAHEIWIEEGKPEGCALHHWLKASWELEQARNPREQVDRIEGDLVARDRD